MDQDLTYACPHPDCDRAFDEEYKLDQHRDDKDHWDWDDDDDECHCETCDECELESEGESVDDETPSPTVRLLPPRQASKKIMSLAGDTLRDPSTCGPECKKALAASHLAVGRLCSICWENRAKNDCPHSSCGNCCSGCDVH